VIRPPGPARRLTVGTENAKLAVVKHAILRVLVVSLVLAPVTLRAWDPEPFRRDDELVGRDFEYSELTFLHHFTYRYRPALNRAWRRERQGFRTTVGSVRSDEFYVLEELRKRFQLNDRLLFDFRQKIDEDFDGRYDRTLTGFGCRLNRGWTATVMGDFVGEKENIDAHLELGWLDAGNREVQFAVVLPDAVFNRKTEEMEYTDRPLTFFAGGRCLAGSGIEIGAWVNVNPALELAVPADELIFSYDQVAAGGEVLLPLGEAWLLILDAGVEEGSRDWVVSGEQGLTERHFKREHRRLGVTFERPPGGRLGGWFGARYFGLTEDDHRPQEAELTGESTREEKMLHAGLTWRLRDDLLLWPGLYLNFVDNEEDFPLNPDLQDTEDGLFAKVALPLEFSFGEGASVTINQTFRFDEARSGGTDVQVIIPF